MRLIIGVLILLPVFAAAETAYVTDNLRLGLHTAEDTSDRAFRFLESGQAMEVLVRDRNYANVRLPDGAEGWVKSAFLVEEKPAGCLYVTSQEPVDCDIPHCVLRPKNLSVGLGCRKGKPGNSGVRQLRQE